jgi:hypothetical protein
MKLIDQNDHPITDPATLPAIEAATQMAIATEEAEDSGEDQPIDPLRITHGKNGVPELPAIAGTTAADETPDQGDDEAADSKLSRRDYMAAKLERMGLRLVAYAADAEGYPVRSSLLSITQLLAEIIAEVRELPAAWKPAKKDQKPSNEIAVGDIVKVRGKAAAIYADAISPAELEHLTVLRVGKLLRCETTSKVVVIINAHHVTKV